MRRIKLLILKARLFAKAGLPTKGFSIAMRAASSAQRAMVMPAMWEAIGALSVILIDLGEFDAARSLVDAIMPQVSLFHSLFVKFGVLIPSRYWKAAIRLRLHNYTRFSQTLTLDSPARCPKRMQKRAPVTLMPHSFISTEHMKVRLHLSIRYIAKC